MSGLVIVGVFCFHIQKILHHVCTTELGSLAKMKPEFDARNCKSFRILNVDPVYDQHQPNSGIEDIKDVCGMKPTYPIIADLKNSFF